jgi:isopentenyl-diphosphate delta-isomerase
MSRETIQQLSSIGVQTIDISGQGGTNFAQIENYRRVSDKFDYLEDWGQSTVISLIEAQPFIDKIEILASGGIRDPLDMVKSLALGARAVGISGLFLHMALRDGVEATILEVNAWKKQIASIMTLLGKKSINDLNQTDVILLGEVKDWCDVRNIDASLFANRSSQNR